MSDNAEFEDHCYVLSMVALAGFMVDSTLNEYEKALHDLHWFACMVGNGGLTKFFYGGNTENYVPEILDSIRRIDIPETLAILESAIAQFPDEADITDLERRHAIRPFIDHDELTRLSKELFKINYYDAKRVLEFIDQNRGKIRFDYIHDQGGAKCVFYDDKIEVWDDFDTPIERMLRRPDSR